MRQWALLRARALRFLAGGPEEDARVLAPARWRPHRPWRRYVWSAALVAAATLLGVPAHRFVSPTNLVMLYLAVVVAAAIYLGRGPAALAAGLGVLAFDYFFVNPRLSFSVADTEYLLTFAGLFVVSLVISTLAARSREQAEAAQRREAQAVALAELSRDLAAARDRAEIAQVTIRHIAQTFGHPAAILAPGEEELPESGAHYVPLKTARGVIGTLAVRPAEPDFYLAPEPERLLEAFASQSALAIERAELAEQARRAQLSRATEQLQSALLNSISHDLRTPLVSITGALSSLEEDNVNLNDASRHSLVVMAREEAERLNRLVGNLLDMTRIEAGALRAAEEPCDVQEVISAALDRLGERLTGRFVTVDAPPVLAQMDFVLMVQVLVNLLDNALKYSPVGSPVEVTAAVVEGELEVAVADRGPGVPPEDMERIFDKFYRVQRSAGVGGTGLGLAICKGIVEAHHGRIWAQNRPGGGMVVTVALPCPQPTGVASEGT